MFPSKFTFTLHLRGKHLKRKRLTVNCKQEALDDAILSENELQQDVKSEEISYSELDIKTEFNEDDIVKSYLHALNSSVCKKEMEEVKIDYFDTRTTCKLCNKILSKKNLKQHILLGHFSSSSQDENLFTCMICAKAFKNKSLLTRHYKNIHLQKFKIICKICKKQFRTHDTLRRHVQIVHLSDIKVMCTICNKELKHKYCLKEHMKNVHSNSSKITCKICNEQFWKKFLKRHLLRKHTPKSQQLKLINKPKHTLLTFPEKHVESAISKEFKHLIQSNYQSKFNKPCEENIKKEENLEHHEINENVLSPNLILVIPKQEIIENLLDETNTI